MQVNALCWLGDYLMMYVYDPCGESVLYALDARSGEGRYVDGVKDVNSIARYEDRLLIESINDSEGIMEFYLYDPESGELASACAPVAMAEGSYEPYGGFAYSPESGRLFYLTGGSLMAAEDFDFANAEPADAAAIREDIEAGEREIAELERKSWRIPAEDIAWYRGHAAQLAVDRCNYLNAGDALSGLIGQLLSGRMSVDGFLKEIDRRARMRQMEGY